MNSRTVTDSIESRSDPAILVALLADPRRSPEWAPGFADAVTGDDHSGWRATKDGNDFTFRVAARPDAGTVDYLREIAPGTEAGAYIRVIPRPGGGSVVVMTLPLAPDARRGDRRDPAGRAERSGEHRRKPVTGTGQLIGTAKSQSGSLPSVTALSRGTSL